MLTIYIRTIRIAILSAGHKCLYVFSPLTLWPQQSISKSFFLLSSFQTKKEKQEQNQVEPKRLHFIPYTNFAKSFTISIKIRQSIFVQLLFGIINRFMSKQFRSPTCYRATSTANQQRNKRKSIKSCVCWARFVYLRVPFAIWIYL